MGESCREISVLLVDPDKLFTDALQYGLSVESDILVLGTANSEYSACSLLARSLPDILLLNISIFFGSVPGGIRRMREISPNCRIVVLTSHLDQLTTERLRLLGISDCLIKSITRIELVTTIRYIAAQRILPTRSNESAVGNAIERNIRISRREEEILLLVAQGMRNEEIAKHLVIAVGTVKRHMRNIFRKLGAESRIDAVNKAVASYDRFRLPVPRGHLANFAPPSPYRPSSWISPGHRG
ncbi:response regulator transcription factor [Sciscionella marina]|uniref:response regulator transcription factor n=1 Tax=Sciscionella marina TaxID=508770 RepID=UPI000377DECC|nr:response regulator transcription factor [Sciscionella marina]